MNKNLKELERIVEIEADTKGVLLKHIEENEKDFEEIDTKVFELYNKINDIQLTPGDKGDKGEPGYTPIKGVDYFDGENGNDADENKIISKVLLQIPKPKDGYIPIKGVDYFDGLQGEIGLKGDKPKHRWKGTKLQFEKPDGTWGQLIDLKGNTGLTGLPGGSLGASYPSVHFNNSLITTGVRDINFEGSGVDVQVSGTKVNVSITGGDLSGYVPYIGATTNVDLGSNSLILGDYTFNSSNGIFTSAGGFVTSGASGWTAMMGGNNFLIANGTATSFYYDGNQFLRADSSGTKLTALTSNGFVKTSGGTGLLSIDTSTYLTAEADTWQTVMARGASSNVAGRITSASPQLTLGVQNSIAGGIKFWDNDSLNSVTVAPAKHSTASYTVQFPDSTSATKDFIIGSAPASQYILYGTGSAMAGGNKNFTFDGAGTVLIGGTGQDGKLSLYSEQGATDRTWSIEPNTAMTASFSTFGPASLPASNPQVMTMSTGGVMSYLTGTANRLLAFTSTNIVGEVNAPGLTGSYLRGTIGSMPDWSTLVLPNNGTAYTLPVFTGTDTLGELTSVGTTGQILKGNTGAIPSWSDDLILVGKTTTYNNVATAGYGTPAIVDYVALTGQTADIGSTNFTNAGTAGLYRINYYLECTTSDATAGNVSLTISFSDDAGGATIVSANLPLTTTATRIQSSLTNAKQLAQLNSGSISYSTAHTGIYGSAVYALYISVERLN